MDVRITALVWNEISAAESATSTTAKSEERRNVRNQKLRPPVVFCDGLAFGNHTIFTSCALLGKTLTAASCRRIKIIILEREGPLRATVSWSDPTTCCYWEQLWRRGRARKRGFCAHRRRDCAK